MFFIPVHLVPILQCMTLYPPPYWQKGLVISNCHWIPIVCSIWYVVFIFWYHHILITLRISLNPGSDQSSGVLVACMQIIIITHRDCNEALYFGEISKPYNQQNYKTKFCDTFGRLYEFSEDFISILFSNLSKTSHP